MVSRSSRDAALSYAAHGWPVLRCWTTAADGCACRKGADCTSPGKHPYRSPNGIKDATVDLDDIARWRGSYNIAIALGHRGLLALDIDDERVAKALTASQRLRGGETGYVRTRRGIHVYFMVTGDVEVTARDIFLKDNADPIGQIRGRDHYVVAPPSFTVGAKRRYRWIGGMFDRWTPQLASSDDPNEYAVQLLADAGVTVEVARSVPLRDVQVDEPLAAVTRLPMALRRLGDLRDVRMMLAGKVEPPQGGEDRSRMIQRRAAQIAYAAAEHGYRLADRELAGIIKALDAAYFRKYTGRSDRAADIEYMRSAVKVLSLPSAALDQGEDIDEADADAAYIWDEDGEQLLHVTQTTRGRSYHPIANYRPVIYATAVIDDPDEPNKETAWRLRASRNGRDCEFGLRASEYERSRTLAATLTKRLPHNFSIAHKGEEHMLPAIKDLSPADVPQRRVPAVPGWYEHDGEPVYVLPGSDVAISAAGVEQSFHLHREDLNEHDAMLYAPLERYGVGVSLPQTDAERTEAWRAFGRLVTCTRPHVAAAVILQVLGGPLFDAGVRDVPPLVHVVGRTGVMKTSYCLAALSLFGRFTDISAPVTWRSTPLGLSQALHRARHMALLVDDYKRAHGRRGDMVGLIQQYADGSHLVRHTLSGAAFERPRGLLLSNGEDRFRGEASVAARTTTIELREGDVDGPRLAQAQQDADLGVLARVGAMYLRWLAASGALRDDSVREARDVWHTRLLGAKGVVAGHRRTLRSAASLLAIGTVVQRFLAEECPSRRVRRDVRDAVRALRDHFVATSSERAAEVEETAPLDHLAGFLSEKVSAGEAKFRTRMSGADYPKGWSTARVTGWHEDDHLYLSEHLTFAYYQEEMKRRGEDVAHDWSSITQNIRERYGDVGMQIWTVGDAGGEKTSRRVYRVPKSLVKLGKKPSKRRNL